MGYEQKGWQETFWYLKKKKYMVHTKIFLHSITKLDTTKDYRVNLFKYTNFVVLVNSKLIQLGHIWRAEISEIN